MGHKKHILLLCLLFSCCLLSEAAGQQKPKKRFRLPEQLREASGLYYAGPDSLWWQNDGGDAPKLYLTNGKGKLIKSVDIPGLNNRDWEDLTVDEKGRIYIGEFGNNLNSRQDLRIYRYDPADESLDSLRFSYEDQQAFPPEPERANFDMEAFFWFNDSLHLFSKNRLQVGNYYCKHYVLPAEPGTHSARLLDSIYLRKRVITGAAISPDQTMAVLIGYNYRRLLGFLPTSAASMFLFTDFSGSRFFEGRLKRKALSCLLATQYEAVDFVNNTYLYVASERTAFIPPRAKRKRVRKKADLPKS